jgi:hypothetical protein
MHLQYKSDEPTVNEARQPLQWKARYPAGRFCPVGSDRRCTSSRGVDATCVVHVSFFIVHLDLAGTALFS